MKYIENSEPCSSETVEDLRRSVDDLKHALLYAQKEAHKWAQFPQQSPTPILRVRHDRVLVYANQISLPLLAQVGWVLERPLPEPYGGVVAKAIVENRSQVFTVRLVEKIFEFTVQPLPEESCANLYGLDATERQAAMESLYDHEKLLRLFVEHAPIAIAMFDKDMHYLVASARWKQNYSLTGKDIEGVSHYDFLPEISRHWKDVHARALAGSSVSCEMDPFQCADGRTQWLRWDIRPWHKIDDSIGGTIILAEDITKRKYAEDKLVCVNSILSCVIENTPALIYAKDKEGQIIVANTALLNLLGKPRTQVLGRTSVQIQSSEIGRTHMENDARVLDEGRPISFEETSVQDGAIRQWFSIKSPFRNPEGEIIGLVGISMDLTEKKRLEQELIASRNDLNRAQAVARTGSWRIDLLRNILTWSDETYRIFDIPSDTPLTPELFLEHVLPEDRDYVLEKWTAALRGERYDIEHRLNLINTVRWVRERAELEFNKEGTLVGGFGTVQDVTARKLTEEAMLQAKREADKANQAKSDFLAKMSHEIRTPMNAVMGMVELSLQLSTTPLVRDYLQTAMDSARSLLGIINDILDISKVEAGRLALAPTDFDLHELATVLMKSMTALADRKGLKALLDIDPQTPRWVRSDPNRLRQMIINLLGNAIKFTDFGQVGLRLAPAEGSSTEKPILEIAVYDTGAGIPVDFQAHVFEPFAQQTSDQTAEGTGLGLTITRGIVEAMGGAIQLHSTPGAGSEFFIRLPVSKGNPQAVQHAGTDSLLCVGKPLTILVVDDNRVNLKVAVALISRLGHTCETSSDGKGAIALLQASPGRFDMIFMDIEMVGMDGFETTKRIRAGEAGEASKSISIIALSAHALTNFKQQCLAEGMNGFLAKPVSLSDLGRLLGYATSAFSGSEEHTELNGRAASLQRLGGDEALLQELTTLFLQSIPERLQILHVAQDRQDLPALVQIAHALKSPAAAVGEDTCSRLAEQLEQAAKAERRMEIPTLTTKLQKELRRIFSSGRAFPSSGVQKAP